MEKTRVFAEIGKQVHSDLCMDDQEAIENTLVWMLDDTDNYMDSLLDKTGNWVSFINPLTDKWLPEYHELKQYVLAIAVGFAEMFGVESKYQIGVISED